MLSRGNSGGATIITGVNVLPRGAVNTSIHTIAHEELRFCNVRSESSRALPSGLASSQTTPRRPHTTLLTSTQCPITRAVPPRDNIAHSMLAGPTQPCATSRVPCRSSAIAWAHAAASQDAPPRELDAHSSGIGRRDRSSGGSRAQTSRERAASEPSRGQPTHGRVRELHRSTRLKRLTDLESRAAAGSNRSR